MPINVGDVRAAIRSCKDSEIIRFRITNEVSHIVDCVEFDIIQHEGPGVGPVISGEVKLVEEDEGD